MCGPRPAPQSSAVITLAERVRQVTGLPGGLTLAVTERLADTTATGGRKKLTGCRSCASTFLANVAHDPRCEWLHRSFDC
jgi:hypothetical protein